MVRQFDVAKKDADAALDMAEEALRVLAEDTDIEEFQTQCEHHEEDDTNENKGEDDDRFELSEDTHAELEKSTHPVKLVLIEVTFGFLEKPMLNINI